jgi:PEP-CTERM motif
MSLLKKLALSTVLLASQTAFAQVYQLGSITPSSAVSFDTAVFKSSVDFIDYFTFTLTSDAAAVFGSAPDVKIKSGGQTDKTDITAVLMYAGDISFADAIKGDLDKSTEGFSFKNVKAGTYYFAVAGQHRGTLAGNYTFNLAATESIIVSSVPEPESYALLLGGLGLFGFLARRKSI